MTTIVALHDPKIGTVIGSDRQYTMDIKRSGPEKWLKITDNFWIGIAGLAKTISIIKYHVNDLVEHTNDPFVLCNALSEILDQYGRKGDESEEDFPSYQGCMLLASNKKVWGVDSLMTPIPYESNCLTAQGSGGFLAMGAGHVLGSKHDSIDRVYKAVKTGCDLDTYSSGTPWVHLIPKVAKK